MSGGISALLQVLANGSATENALSAAQLSQQFGFQEQDSILANGLPQGFSTSSLGTTGLSPLSQGIGSSLGLGLQGGGLLSQGGSSGSGSIVQDLEEMLGIMEELLTSISGKKGT